MNDWPSMIREHSLALLFSHIPNYMQLNTLSTKNKNWRMRNEFGIGIYTKKEVP